ncbi:LysE family translocator [Psychromonas sp. GE-S-Ul-11]|uniref:LysE family translocator n=1 Tax=Psychromonas sp. GE-S-Ul-11 TaxID=3241170 RepID=UPI00390CA657
MDNNLLLLFIPTFFAVSITPGMCMTLAMTLGMTIGIRRSLWMMLGELVGVGLVALSALIGVATLLLARPNLFLLLKYAGGAYLLYLGIQMWRSRGKMAIPATPLDNAEVKRGTLISQGFITAIANPKGWAFMISLLPPFINPDSNLLPQATQLIAVILCFELTCMLLYATGGKTLRHLLQQQSSVKLLNRIAGSMMMLVAVWLVIS